MIFQKLTSEIDTALNNFDEYLEENNNAMMYFTADIPLEIISAFNFIPIRIPSEIEFNSKNKSTNAIFQPFICSKSRQMLDFLINNNIKHAIFSENHCDSLQNLYDVLRLNESIPNNFQYFRFLLPVNRGGKAETKYYQKEIKRLVTWFEKTTGEKLTSDKLKSSITLHNTKRKLLNTISDMVLEGKIQNNELFKLKLGSDMFPVQKSIDLLNSIIDDRQTIKESNPSPKVILSGSMFDNFEIFEKIPVLNNAVAFNDLTFGSRSTTFEINNQSDDLDTILENISKAYIKDRISDSVHFYPNQRRDYLLSNFERTKAKGVIFIYYSFCDPDAFETRNLSRHLEKRDIPILTLVTDPKLTNIEQLATRVEAFLERIGDL